MRLSGRDLASVALTVCTGPSERRLSVVLSILGILLDQRLHNQPKSERRTARGEGPPSPLLVARGCPRAPPAQPTRDMVLKRPAFLWVFVL